MKNELEYKILEYLQKNGATNTFKLAHVLDIKRDKLVGILKNLEEQGAVKIVTGKVEFLSYPPSKEKKKQKPKVSKEKSEIQTLQENVEKQKLEIRGLRNKIKKLRQKPVKIIRRVIIKEKEPEAKPPKPLKPVKAKKTKKAKKFRFKLKFPKLRLPKIKIRIPKLKLPKLKIKSKSEIKKAKAEKIKKKKGKGLFTKISRIGKTKFLSEEI